MPRNVSNSRDLLLVNSNPVRYKKDTLKSIFRIFFLKFPEVEENANLHAQIYIFIYTLLKKWKQWKHNLKTPIIKALLGET